MLVSDATQTVQTLLTSSGLFGKLLRRSGTSSSSSSSTASIYAQPYKMAMHLEKPARSDVADSYYPRKGHDHQKTLISKSMLVRLAPCSALCMHVIPTCAHGGRSQTKD